MRKAWIALALLLGEVVPMGQSALATNKNADDVPYVCMSTRERCVIPVYISSTTTKGVFSCKAEIPFTPIMVPKSQTPSGKPIRVVWLLVNRDVSDHLNYEFLPNKQGVIFNSTVTPANDPTQDFAEGDLDAHDTSASGNDRRKFKWRSVNMRTVTPSPELAYTVQVQVSGKVPIPCDTADPRIVNVP